MVNTLPNLNTLLQIITLLKNEANFQNTNTCVYVLYVFTVSSFDKKVYLPTSWILCIL